MALETHFKSIQAEFDLLKKKAELATPEPYHKKIAPLVLPIDIFKYRVECYFQYNSAYALANTGFPQHTVKHTTAFLETRYKQLINDCDAMTKFVEENRKETDALVEHNKAVLEAAIFFLSSIGLPKTKSTWVGRAKSKLHTEDSPWVTDLKSEISVVNPNDKLLKSIQERRRAFESYYNDTYRKVKAAEFEEEKKKKAEENEKIKFHLGVKYRVGVCLRDSILEGVKNSNSLYRLICGLRNLDKRDSLIIDALLPDAEKSHPSLAHHLWYIRDTIVGEANDPIAYKHSMDIIIGFIPDDFWDDLEAAYKLDGGWSPGRTFALFVDEED